jgi:hypothetical protein
LTFGFSNFDWTYPPFLMRANPTVSSECRKNVWMVRYRRFDLTVGSDFPGLTFSTVQFFVHFRAGYGDSKMVWHSWIGHFLSELCMDEVLMLRVSSPIVHAP